MEKDKLEKILKKERIYHFDTDMRLLDRKTLAKHFATKKGRIVLTRLIRSIIWQAYEKIRLGEEPTIEGNLRTFWYLWIKPVLSHIPDDDNVRTDPYDTFLGELARMVMDLSLFRYADFDFTDENWENRRIGDKHPQILLFAEKRGWLRFLNRFHAEKGISILTLGGAPSALTSEYTAQRILDTLPDRKTPLHLIGIVDFDPSGEIIANAFQNQMKSVGVSHSTLSTLIHPKHYTEQELAMFKFPLPKGQKTKTRKWLENTGGINGQRYGLESESFSRKRLSVLIRQKIEKLLP